MVATTPVYGIKYPTPGDPIRNTRQYLQDNATTIEAALAAKALAPPGTPDLAAAVARIGVLEAARTVTTALVLKNSFTAVGGYRAPYMSRTDKSVTVYAFVTGGPGAGGVVTTLPVGSRPAADLFIGYLAQTSGTNTATPGIVRATGNVELYGATAGLQAVMFTFTAEQ